MSEEETRERTSAILGRPVSDSAWTEAWEKAKRKIRHIAEFCGYDGCRERPGYMAQLAETGNVSFSPSGKAILAEITPEELRAKLG